MNIEMTIGGSLFDQLGQPIPITDFSANGHKKLQRVNTNLIALFVTGKIAQWERELNIIEAQKL